MEKNSDIIIYQSNDGKTFVDVKLEKDTVWLSLNQISMLFDKDKSNISRHIKNIFKEGELDEIAVVAKNATTASDGKTYQVDYYNLDIILSVGYRVNSKNATNFRIWATQTLKKHLVDGYTINEKRLKENVAKFENIKIAIDILERGIVNQIQDLSQAKELVGVLADFSKGLALLDDYDNERLDKKGKNIKKAKIINKKDFLDIIEKMKLNFASAVFAVPKDESFDSSIAQIYQSLGDEDCYPSLEEKAAMLLYFITKNHSFLDGNKRIAASCFLHFLNENAILYKNGKKIIENETLFALTLLIAESKPAEKEVMKNIIISVLNRE